LSSHPVVSPSEWLAARRRLLEQEKDFTRRRDELAARRRELPWTRVEKPYRFVARNGPQSLGDLFGPCSQLIVYHFMFDPTWTEGCKSCSFLADHYAPAVVHLRHRDVSLVTVSRAPLEKLLAFQRRMGWSFDWVSSSETDFNHDFQVTFTPQELAAGTASYNYGSQPFPVAEAPGLSVFYKDDAGEIYHTYSTYARGLDMFITAYHLLDVVPRGRDEADLKYGMEWVRHHDRYGDQSFVDPYVQLFPKGPVKP
jgi:predicted dithiol-disulfide oxidoreductase (DUF899 family)